MADTVNTQVINDGMRNYVVHLINKSDGTGESAVKKIDISTLSDGPTGATPTKLSLQEASWNVSGGTVSLYWDATTDDEILLCSGNSGISFVEMGGLNDPASTGATGDVLLTTNGFANGDSYDITLWFKKK